MAPLPWRPIDSEFPQHATARLAKIAATTSDRGRGSAWRPAGAAARLATGFKRARSRICHAVSSTTPQPPISICACRTLRDTCRNAGQTWSAPLTRPAERRSRKTEHETLSAGRVWSFVPDATRIERRLAFASGLGFVPRPAPRVDTATATYQLSVTTFRISRH
jgi:hypothetical protein